MLVVIIVALCVIVGIIETKKESKTKGVKKRDSLVGPIIAGSIIGLISGFVEGITKRK